MSTIDWWNPGIQNLLHCHPSSTGPNIRWTVKTYKNGEKYAASNKSRTILSNITPFPLSRAFVSYQDARSNKTIHRSYQICLPGALIYSLVQQMLCTFYILGNFLNIEDPVVNQRQIHQHPSRAYMPVGRWKTDK